MGKGRRNTRITHEFVTKISGAVEAGMSPRNAILAVGIPESTYGEWLQKSRSGLEPYATLFKATKQAEALSLNQAEIAVQKAIKKGDFKALKWFLEMRDPAQYRPVSRREITGLDGAPIEHSLVDLSVDQLVAMAAGEEDVDPEEDGEDE